MGQATIRDIARLCGVGVSTVSRAINNHPDINEETKNKILETIRQEKYVPNNSARNLKRSESRTVALLVKGIENPFFGTMIQTMEREIEKNRYSFIIQQIEEQEDELETAILLEKEKRLKGVIFLGGMVNHTREQFERLTVPFVISTVPIPLPEDIENGAVVSIDDEEESCRMVRRLIGLGHRRIAMITAGRDDQSIGRSRLLGYRRALEENGLPFDESLVVYYEGRGDVYTMPNGYDMAGRLLARGGMFTCLYCASDTLAAGACKAVLESELRVPEDISVAGFDGLDIAKYYHPDIMTLCQPREEMARETVHQLFLLIRGGKGKRHTVFEASIREGRSAANAPGEAG